MMTVSSEVMLAEIDLAQRVMTKWADLIKNGVPMVESPGTEESLEDFIRKFCGEMMVVSGKLETLATVVGEGVTR